MRLFASAQDDRVLRGQFFIMIKNVFGRKFSRDTNQRKALFKSLITALIFNESIKTTMAKAKAIKGDIDKIINKAKKKGNGLAVQLLQRRLGMEAINKVIKDISPRFTDRNSGYTRLTKLGRRFSDNADMVLMEWVVKPEIRNPALPAGREKLKMKNDIKELPAGKLEEKPKAKKEKVTKK